MSCGIGHRYGLDLALLWLWRRLVATALIRPLAWEPPCAVGAALKRPKKKKVKVSAGLLALWSTKEVFISLFCLYRKLVLGNEQFVNYQASM